MAHKLYVVHGSHPCDTVAKALELKGIPYKIVELTPPAHAPFMRARFGARTVPGIKFDDGTKVQGSRAILRHLDAMRARAARWPANARVDEAERWGDEVLQPIARRLLWPAFQRSPRAMARLPGGRRSCRSCPAGVVAAIAPLITRIERSMNDATDEACRGRPARAARPPRQDRRLDRRGRARRRRAQRRRPADRADAAAAVDDRRRAAAHRGPPCRRARAPVVRAAAGQRAARARCRRTGFRRPRPA